MFHSFENRLVLTGTLTAQTALRVGGGKSTVPTGSDLPVLRDAQGRPYIPGSGFKGVLRSRVESVVRAVAGEKWGSCIPTAEDADRCLPDKRVKEIKQAAKSDEAAARTLWQEGCLICRTFGAPWLASAVYIKDLLVETELWFGQYQVRNGVAIDRDTETAAEGLLYDYEVVPADTPFQFELFMENSQPWQLGLVHLGLKAFEDGEIAIGGFRSRGLGRVKLQWTGRYYEVARQWNAGRPDVDWVIRYLEGKEPGVDARSKMSDWVKAFRQELAEAARKAGESHA